jgi:hypothetical protein
METLKKFIAGSTVVALSLGTVGVFAQNSNDETTLSVEVTDGTLVVLIADDAGDAVASPSVTMTSVTSGFSDGDSTGTLGVAGSRILVENPRDNELFQVTIQATNGVQDQWVGSASTSVNPTANTSITWTVSGTDDDVNDQLTASADVSGDVKPGDSIDVGTTPDSYVITAISADGLTITVNKPLVASYTDGAVDASTCGNGFKGVDANTNDVIGAGECNYAMPFNEADAAGNAHLTLAVGSVVAEQANVSPADGSTTYTGGQYAVVTDTDNTYAGGQFIGGTNDVFTLWDTDTGFPDYGKFSLTGVGLTQQVPAQTPADTYTLDLTLTVLDQ